MRSIQTYDLRLDFEFIGRVTAREGTPQRECVENAAPTLLYAAFGLELYVYTMPNAYFACYYAALRSFWYFVCVRQREALQKKFEGARGTLPPPQIIIGASLSGTRI